MKIKTYLALFLAFTIIAAGCSSQDNSSTSASTGTQDSRNVSDNSSTSADTENNTASKGGTSEIPAVTDISKIFSDRDYEVGYDEGTSAMIQLNGDSAACSSDAVQISGSTVTITDEGTYILSGTLDDGMIIVNTDKSDKVQLVLDNAAIHSETCAPIYILQSDKVFITTAASSTNTLSNGGTFTAIDENNIDAVIFSKEDMTLNGSGTLAITSPAGHGIVSKDSLKITSGSYDINGASHAISGKDDVCIANADFTIISGKDGIHAENADDTSLGYVYIQSGTFHISAEGDGITASSCLQIEDGSFEITAGGGSVNASSHNSGSWGDFQGGGRHGGGKREGGRPDMNREPNDGINKHDGMTGASSSATEISNMAYEPDSNTSGHSSMAGATGTSNMADNPDDSANRHDSTTGATVSSNMAAHPDGRTGRHDSTAGATVSSNMAAHPDGHTGRHDSMAGATVSSNAADGSDGSTSMKGMKASASLIINGGEFTINSADDSFHSNGSVTVNGGTFDVASGDDAFHADGTLAVIAGTISITESYEGLEGAHVNVSGGDITLTASDDGLNAAGGTDSSGDTGGRDGMFGHGMPSSDGSITISGGTLKITASGDGIDANGTLDITGGYITVSGPTQGDTATLDYDAGGTISGGTFIGTGASNAMAQTFSDSEQGVISVNVENQSAGTQIQLSDSAGNTVITYTPELDFALVILSSPDIISGETYTLTVGASSGEFTAS